MARIAVDITKKNNRAGRMKIKKRLPLFFLHLGIVLCVTLLELLDPTGGINKFLLACEKRMACRTDFDLDLTHNGTELHLVAAGTDRLNLVIFGMNSFFHSYYSSNTQGYVMFILYS